jgi:hypothetical protein
MATLQVQHQLFCDGHHTGECGKKSQGSWTKQTQLPRGFAETAFAAFFLVRFRNERKA